MPVWDKVAFDRFYWSLGERYGRPGSRPPIVLGYHWYPIIQYQATKYAPMLRTTLDLNAGEGVVIVGAGFNGTGAGLAALGVNVVATETSAYILGEKDQTEEAEIRAAIQAVGLNPDTDKIIGPSGKADADPLDMFLDGGRAAPKARGKGTILAEDGSSRRSRNTIKGALASNPRYIISEEVLNSISDADALAVCEIGARFVAENGGTIVHMLSPLQTDARQEPDLNWKTYAQWRAFLNANGFAAQKILPTVTAGGVTAYSGLL